MPPTRKRKDIDRRVGRNHPQPSRPQYSVSDKEAAADTEASPKRTRTTLGRQHMVASKAGRPMTAKRDLPPSLESPAMLFGKHTLI
tara:strand:- start:208 stop:465 length:258 start_codon:yes stop_codon:yes gene_type:complete